MDREASLTASGTGEPRLEDYLSPEGKIAIPAGMAVTSFLDRNVAALGDVPAYRYLDFDRDCTVELTWSQLGTRLRAVGARLQQVSQVGDRVAILAPQGVDYVVGFFAAIQAGAIAVPLFAPELPGHAERLDTVLASFCIMRARYLRRLSAVVLVPISSFSLLCVSVSSGCRA